MPILTAFKLNIQPCKHRVSTSTRWHFAFSAILS